MVSRDLSQNAQELCAGYPVYMLELIQDKVRVAGKLHSQGGKLEEQPNPPSNVIKGSNWVDIILAFACYQSQNKHLLQLMLL